MKKSLLLIFFAFYSIIFITSGPAGSAQTLRKVVMEEGTNSSCGPCALQNPSFQEWLADNQSRVIPVVYHAWWPGKSDPMYQYDTAMQNNRITYYGMQNIGVPCGRMNGLVPPPTGNNYEGSVGDTLALTQFLATQAYYSPLEIKLTLNNNSGSGSVKVDVTTLALLPANTRLRIVIAEEHHYYEKAGSNGEKDFYFLARQMLPDYSGTELDMAEGQTKTFNFDFEVDPDFSDGLYAVAFIQNDITGEILQAESSLQMPPMTPPAFEMVSMSIGNKPYAVSVTGSDTKQMEYVVVNNGTTDITCVSKIEKSARTPGDWIITSTENEFTVPANSKKSVTLSVQAASHTNIGEARLIFNRKDKPTVKYNGSYLILVPSNLETISILGGEKTHSLEPIVTKQRNYQSFNEINSGDFLKISGSLTNIKNLVWNGSTTGTIGSFEASFLAEYINNGNNLMICGGLVTPGVVNNGLQELFGVQWLHWCFEGYGSSPWRIWLNGVENDPITGFFGVKKEGNLINYLTPLFKINDPATTPLLYHNKHQDSIVAVKMEKENNQRLILLGINPFIIVNKTLREQLIKNCLDWLETGVTTSVNDNIVPDRLTLKASPNPANGRVDISFNSGEGGKQFRLSLFDTKGREIKLIKSGQTATGENFVSIETDDLPSGSYTLMLVSGAKNVTFPLVLLK